MAKNFKFRHTQHTKKFQTELFGVNNKTSYIPFRISDEVWIAGKYKGKKISDTPSSYLNWSIKNMQLSSIAIDVLKKYI